MSILLNFLFLFFSAIFCLFFYISYRLSFWYRQNVPFELTPYFKVNKRLLGDIDKECLAKHGRIFGTFELLTPVLIVSDPDLIGRILINEFSKFSDRRKVLIKGQMGAENIFSSDYKQWKKLRTILAPAFTVAKMKSMQPIFTKSIDKLLIKLANSAKYDKETNLLDYYKEFIIESSVATILGVEIDWVDTNNLILKSVDKFFDLTKLTLKHVVYLMSIRIAKLFDWYFLDYEAIKYLNGVAQRVIEMKRKQINKENGLMNTLLDTEELSEAEIKDNVVALILASYQSSPLAKITYLMALHPEAQDKLCSEIDAVWSKKLDSSKNDHQPDITWEDLTEMPYLDAVFNETLRLYPNSPRLERRVPEDTWLTDTRYGDIFLLKNTLVCISLAIGRDLDYWSEPDKFDPERFLPENKHLNHPYAHFPFALGPRNCLGCRFGLLEVRLCIFHVFKKFRFEVSPSTQIPLQFKNGLFPFYASKDVTLKVIARD